MVEVETKLVAEAAKDCLAGGSPVAVRIREARRGAWSEPGAQPLMGLDDLPTLLSLVAGVEQGMVPRVVAQSVPGADPAAQVRSGELPVGDMRQLLYPTPTFRVRQHLQG